MSSYNLQFNKDDSVIRHIIIGLCADLNKKLHYNQIVDGQPSKIEVPFLYSFTGDEDFLHEYFLLDNSVDPEKAKAIGNYETKPRGVVNLTGVSIDSNSLLNKYVRGTYQKLEEGKMKAYVAQFQMIPVILTFQAKIIVDTQLDIFRVLEKIIKQLYKNNTFQVDVGTLDDGTYRIASYYKLPEDYEAERPIEFGFDDKKERSINFNIDVNSFIPSFDESDEQFAGNRMFGFKSKPQLGDTSGNKPIGGPDSLWSKTKD